MPLLKESYPELDYVAWFAMLAPPGTPAGIVKKMNEAVNKVIATDPEIKEQLLKTALAPAGGSPEDLAEVTRKDNERFGALIRKLNIRAD